MIERGIGRIRDGLFLQGGVSNHPTQFGIRNNPLSATKFDGFLQQGLRAFNAAPFSPAGKRRSVAGQLMFKIFVATKVLSVGIFKKLCDHGLIAQVVTIFQIMKLFHGGMITRESRNFLAQNLRTQQSGNKFMNHCENKYWWRLSG